MNLRDLEYLVSLAIDGHFRRAAERCNVSQPTLSAQIAKLEDALGVQLFERGPRGATPTVNGRAVIAEAQAVLDAVGKLREAARAARDPLAGPFRLGAIPTAGPYLLPRMLPVLRQAYPALRLVLHEAVTDRLVEALRSGGLDAAILSPPIADDADLRSAPLIDEAILLALPAGHPLAARARVAAADLAAERVILMEDGHCLRGQTQALCTSIGLADRRDVQAASVESLRQMVMAGSGVALLPECAATGPFAASTLAVYRRFDGTEPTRRLALVWRRTFPRGDALAGLAATLGTAFAAAPAGGA